jgi:hypothetical protein
MSDTPKKSNRRRRRRPRRRTKTTKTSIQTAGIEADRPSADKTRSTNKKQRRSRSDRRRKQQKGNGDLIVQRHDKVNLDVSSINKDIFIYTYTLRPQSLLDNYQVGPSVVENMEFEDAGSTNNHVN